MKLDFIVFNSLPNDKTLEGIKLKAFENNKSKFSKPFPKQALVFTCLQNKSFKTMWEKETFARNFSFSHSVFYPYENLSAIFIKFKIVVCKH